MFFTLYEIFFGTSGFKRSTFPWEIITMAWYALPLAHQSVLLYNYMLYKITTCLVYQSF